MIRYSLSLISSSLNKCFQKHPLDFAGTTSDILYPNGTRITFPLKTTRVGTSPPGSQWARDPVPGCYMCDAYQQCGAPLAPVPGTGDICSNMTTEAKCESTMGRFKTNCTWYSSSKGSKPGTCYDKPPTDTVCKPITTETKCEATTSGFGTKCQWYSKAGAGTCYAKPTPSAAQIWNQQVDCYASCDGSTSSKAGGMCPDGTAVFPEPAPGISGFGKGSFLLLSQLPTFVVVESCSCLLYSCASSKVAGHGRSLIR